MSFQRNSAFPNADAFLRCGDNSQRFINLNEVRFTVSLFTSVSQSVTGLLVLPFQNQANTIHIVQVTCCESGNYV